MLRTKDLIEALDQIILQYLGVNGLSYKVVNDIFGALEGAKVEYRRRRGVLHAAGVVYAVEEVKSNFYSRVVAPYEDEKIKQNGDVY